MSLLLLAAAGAEQVSASDAAFLKAVGSILRQRTVLKGSAGRELGTFDTTTRPTGAQVLELRDDQAREDLEGVVGPLDDLPTQLADDAESLLRLGTALQVELTYFAGDVAAKRSPYEQLDKRYERRVAALVKNIGQIGDGLAPGVTDPTPAPVYSFPPAPYHDWGW